MNSIMILNILLIFGLTISIFFVLKIYIKTRFEKCVKNLFAYLGKIIGKTFSYQQLEGLPLPVQRYFKYVMKEGQPYISYGRLKHNGQFKTDLKKGWVNITGEQYFTLDRPGFIWKGKTSLFVAIDEYLLDKGRLAVRLLSFLKIVDGKGPAYDQGELLRWLSENIWFPTNLLPSNRLAWQPIDQNTAKLTFNYLNLNLYFIVTFNELGEIIQMETQRFMSKTKMETWICKIICYDEKNGIQVPVVIEACWRLENVDYPYAKFHVIELEYDVPKSFKINYTIDAI